MVFLSVVIPAYNEGRRITKSIEKICRYLSEKGWSHEIIIVDDGSEDNLPSVVKSLKRRSKNIAYLKNRRNRGMGFSVRRGVLASKGEYVLYTDADLSTPVEEFDRFLPLLRSGYDIVIGSRSVKGSRITASQPPHRILLGKAFRYVNRLIVMKKLANDTQCGFKAFRGETARKLFSLLTIDGGMFNVELLYIASKMRTRYKEIPVSWENDPRSNINVLKCIFFDPIDLARIRYNDLRRRYAHKK